MFKMVESQEVESIKLENMVYLPDATNIFDLDEKILDSFRETVYSMFNPEDTVEHWTKSEEGIWVKEKISWNEDPDKPRLPTRFRRIIEERDIKNSRAFFIAFSSGQHEYGPTISLRLFPKIAFLKAKNGNDKIAKGFYMSEGKAYFPLCREREDIYIRM